jgi:hypothetical protein
MSACPSAECVFTLNASLAHWKLQRALAYGRQIDEARCLQSARLFGRQAVDCEAKRASAHWSNCKEMELFISCRPALRSAIADGVMWKLSQLRAAAHIVLRHAELRAEVGAEGARHVALDEDRLGAWLRWRFRRRRRRGPRRETHHVLLVLSRQRRHAGTAGVLRKAGRSAAAWAAP